MLKVLVTASHNHLTVFALPDSINVNPGVVPSGLSRIRTIGGMHPLNFKFTDVYDIPSGLMAFTGAATATRLLLVTDAGNEAVHVIDVVHGAHVGYVAAPGSIAGPRGVAAWGTKVAVSAHLAVGGCSFVQLYEGTGASWTIGRLIISAHVLHPCGVRFTDDGKELAVAADSGLGFRGGVSLLRTDDGAFVRHVVTGLAYVPADVEDCVDNGWAVVDWRGHRIPFVGGASDQGFLGAPGSGHGELIFPSAVAFVPGLGLIVREYGNGGRVQLFATPDAVAMAAMSVMRTTWMATVARFRC